MPHYYHTDWTPQFGAPILPPELKKEPQKKQRRGSWRNPSPAMIERELAKCTVKKIDVQTGEVLEEQQPTSHRQATEYGKTGKKPMIPQKSKR